VERKRAKEVREKERAEKAAKKARQKEAQPTKNPIQKPQNNKRKALRVSQLAGKRQKQSVVDAGGGAAYEPSSAPLLKTTSCGRNVNLPKKFR
jgi:hypothetical protein